MSNLQLRIVSALVLAVLVLGLTWLGGLPFRLLAVVIAAAIFYEWTAMSRVSGDAAHKLTVTALLGFVLILLAAGVEARFVFLVLLIAMIASALDARWRSQGNWTLTGLAYAALSGIALAFLRDSDSQGLVAILFLFATVWATDILAYFVGRAVGGPKLAPSISPGKTWSGAAGGAIGGTIAGLLVAQFSGGWASPSVLFTALFLSVVSQAGDLFESAIKRRFGVKDSSRLIPGHGGVMDRVDGLVAAAIALYVIGLLIGGADHPAHGLIPV